MDTARESRRINGALSFLADLETFAAECTAHGIAPDELALRRRQREDARSSDVSTTEARVKAL